MIIRDSRERNKTLMRELPEEEMLEHGDFLIEVEIDDGGGEGEAPTRILLIERKTFVDALNSWHSGRLDKQIQNVDVLLVEWCYIPKKLRGKTIENLRKHLNSIAFFMPVIYTMTSLQTANEVKRLEKKLKRNELGVIRGRPEKGYAVNSKINFLARFPGVSLHRAGLLIEHYLTLEEVIDDIDNWHKHVKGIGKKTCKTCSDWYREEMK